MKEKTGEWNRFYSRKWAKRRREWEIAHCCIGNDARCVCLLSALCTSANVSLSQNTHTLTSEHQINHKKWNRISFVCAGLPSKKTFAMRAAISFISSRHLLTMGWPHVYVFHCSFLCVFFEFFSRMHLSLTHSFELDSSQNHLNREQIMNRCHSTTMRTMTTTTL